MKKTSTNNIGMNNSIVLWTLVDEQSTRSQYNNRIDQANEKITNGEGLNQNI